MRNALIRWMMVVEVLLVWGTVARGEHPLLEGRFSIRDVGPRTEPVDLADYSQVFCVAAREPRDSPGKGTPEDPFATPAEAFEAAARLAQTGARCAVLFGASRFQTDSLKMVSGVDLFGGFDPTFTNRDIFQFSSVLEGGPTGPVVVAATDARLDGFRVTGGKNRASGGGILCDHVSPILSNNFIFDNLTLEPAGFDRDMIHQHGSDGGGIAILSGAGPVVRNNLIYGNRTEIGMGAGLCIWNECAPKVVGNVFLQNEAGVAGREGKEGSRSSNGGAIAVSKNCQPEIFGNIVAHNRVYDNSDGGGIYLEYDGDAVLRANWIVGNRGDDDGGGIYIMKNSEPLLEGNIIAGNRNTTDGSGGIRLSKEGRMRAHHNLMAMNPGTIDAVAAWMVLAHNTMVGATNESIIFENELEHMMPSRIEGNLIHGTGSRTLFIKQCATGVPVARNNLVRGGCEGEGNVDLAPDFLDDGLRGEILRTAFDPTRQLTLIHCGETGLNETLAGRVLRVDRTWTVIQGVSEDGLVVWGGLPKEAKEFEIQPSFRPASRDSPSARYGAYAVSNP